MTDRAGTVDGDEARRRLHEIAVRDGPLRERVDGVLRLGVEYLGVQNGHVAEIDRESDHWEAVASTDPTAGTIPTGLSLQLANTYCRHAIQRDHPLACHDVEAAALELDAAHESTGLRCYHGAAITLDDELYGTVCFVSADPRAEPFTDEERLFVDLAATLLGHAVQRARHEHRVTEQRQAVLERAERLRSLVDASFDAIVTLDGTGRVVAVAGAQRDLLGYDPEALRGTSYAELVASRSDFERASAALRRVRADETARELDLELLDDGGRAVHVDASVAPIYEVEDPGETAFALGDDGFGLGSSDGTWLDPAPEPGGSDDGDAPDSGGSPIPWLAALGDPVSVDHRDGPSDDVDGTGAEADETGTDADGSENRVDGGQGRVDGDQDRVDDDPDRVDGDQGRVDGDQDRVDGDQGRVDGDPVHVDGDPVHVDGDPVHVDDDPDRVDGDPVRVDAGEPDVVGATVVLRDASHRQRYEHLVSVLQRVLRHNVRNALNVVHGAAEQAEPASDADRRELARIQQTAAELLALSEKAGALESAMAAADDPRPIDLRELAEPVVDRVARRYPDAELRLDVEGRPAARATESVERAVEELVENAAKHGGDEVELRIVERDADEDPRAVSDRASRSTDRPSTVVVAVSDDGPGIPDQEQTVLTAGEESPLEHGSGLGHWFVYWIVTGLGGDVSATVDDGTTVRLRLPAANLEERDNRRDAA